MGHYNWFKINNCWLWLGIQWQFFKSACWDFSGYGGWSKYPPSLQYGKMGFMETGRRKRKNQNPCQTWLLAELLTNNKHSLPHHGFRFGLSWVWEPESQGGSPIKLIFFLPEPDRDSSLRLGQHRFHTPGSKPPRFDYL